MQEASYRHAQKHMYIHTHLCPMIDVAQGSISRILKNMFASLTYLVHSRSLMYKNSVACSPQANYTDRTTAACRPS
jgi:hypothetical protein